VLISSKIQSKHFAESTRDQTTILSEH